MVDNNLALVISLDPPMGNLLSPASYTILTYTLCSAVEKTILSTGLRSGIKWVKLAPLPLCQAPG